MKLGQIVDLLDTQSKTYSISIQNTQIENLHVRSEYHSLGAYSRCLHNLFYETLKQVYKSSYRMSLVFYKTILDRCFL